MTETCCHGASTTPEKEDNVTVISRKYLLRQILVCSGIYAANFSYGVSFGAPTVLIPQIRQQANSSDAVTIGMTSTLSSTSSYSGAVSAVILVILAKLIGRKLSFLFICVTSLIGYIVFYLSRNTTHIVSSEILHGPLAATPLTVSIMVITEYTSPGYRGVFLGLKASMFLWGIWVANTIGTFFHWKIIGILGILCSTYSLITVLSWPESPYWLISRNRFEDCALSHRWLKGCSKESEKELELMVQSRKRIQSIRRPKQSFIKSCGKIFRSKLFYKPFLLALLLASLYHYTGKLACGMYAIDIIKQITRSESTAYTVMLVLDGISVFGMYVGSGLSKIVNRRSLLLVSSTIGVTFLFSISFYLYLIYLEVINECTITSIVLLIGYSLAISVGPLIMCPTILSELMPVKYRSSSILFLGCITNFLLGSAMKVSPFIIEYCGVHGLFICFAVLEFLFILIAYKVLPETKDKPILEIQEAMLGKKVKRETVDSLIPIP